MRLTDVPLFPLELVLFPQMVLPLHIFEQRYREMINECVKEGKPFGIVMLTAGDSVQEGRTQSEIPQPAAIGTLAKITEVTRVPDGRMIIETIGTERFRLLEYRNDKPYMTGDIELWPDGEADNADLENEITEVRTAFKEYLNILMELAGRKIQGLEIPETADALSYFIPNWLQITTVEKQKLLEASNPYERLRQERIILLGEFQLLQKVKEESAKRPISDNLAKPTEETSLAGGTLAYNVSSRFSKN